VALEHARAHHRVTVPKTEQIPQHVFVGIQVGFLSRLSQS
jgi:hypothetical protein